MRKAPGEWEEEWFCSRSGQCVIESEDELCKQQVTSKGVQWAKDEMRL